MLLTVVENSVLKNLVRMLLVLSVVCAPCAFAEANLSIEERIQNLESLSGDYLEQARSIERFLRENPLPEGADEEMRKRYSRLTILKNSYEERGGNLQKLTGRLEEIAGQENLSDENRRGLEGIISQVEGEVTTKALPTPNLSVPVVSEVAETRVVKEAPTPEITVKALPPVVAPADSVAVEESKAESIRDIAESADDSEAERQRVLQENFGDIEYEIERRQQAEREAKRQRKLQEEFGDIEYEIEKRQQAERAANDQRKIQEQFGDIEYEIEKRNRELKEQERQRELQMGLADVENAADRASEEARELERQRRIQEEFGDIEYQIEKGLLADREAGIEDDQIAQTVEENRLKNEGTAAAAATTDTTAPEEPPKATDDEKAEEEPTDTDDLETKTVQYVELTCRTALNVRRKATTESDRLEDISCRDFNNRQTKVLILEEKDGFYKVFVNGSLGWISGEYTTEPRDLSEESSTRTSYYKPQQGRLNCRSRLNRRTGPSTSYRIVGKIPCRSGGQGTPVTILGKHEDTGWYIAEYNGERTWVSNRYVDVGDPDALQVLTNEIIQGLDAAPDLGDVGINCEPGSIPVEGECVNFNFNFYTKSDSAQTMAASINQAKQRGISAKKQRFFELFGPLAIEIQTRTGWPASVALAQMAIETNWGTSNVFKRLNNFGGHSCTRYNPNGSRPLRNRHLRAAASREGRSLPGYFVDSNGSPRLRSACTYPRPRNERHYYRTFENVTEAAFLYADNVLENRHYRDAQNHVKSRFEAGQKADPETVVRGLRAYAADTSYRRKLMQTINANNLTRFDEMRSCD
jgi:uncharacterized protein YgiM (DUF1202 family)